MQKKKPAIQKVHMAFKPENHRKFLSFFLTGLLLCTFVTMFSSCSGNEASSVPSEVSSEAISSEQISSVETSSVPEKIESDFDFEPYTSVNSDVVGYMDIYGTTLQEIIVQSTNGERDYYIYRDWKGNSDNHGTVYFDNNFDFTDPADKVWLAYGHNNSNGTGFPELHQYNPTKKGDAEALAYYNEHYLMQLDTVDQAGEWQIFAVFVVADSEILDGFNYMQTDFENETQYQAYIDNILIRSLFVTPIEVTTNNQIVLLQTCITNGYNYYGNQYKDWRLIVAAKRVVNGQDTSIDTSLTEINSNPLMPNVWHKNTGVAKPTELPGLSSNSSGAPMPFGSGASRSSATSSK